MRKATAARKYTLKISAQDALEIVFPLFRIKWVYATIHKRCLLFWLVKMGSSKYDLRHSAVQKLKCNSKKFLTLL